MFTWCFLFGITRHASKSIADNDGELMNLINWNLVAGDGMNVHEGESLDCQREASSALPQLGSCVYGAT